MLDKKANIRLLTNIIRLLTCYLNTNTGEESVYWPKYVPYVGWRYGPFQLASVGSFSGLAMMSQTKQLTGKLAGGKLLARQATRYKINIARLVIAHKFLYYFTLTLFKLCVKLQVTQTTQPLMSLCRNSFSFSG